MGKKFAGLAKFRQEQIEAPELEGEKEQPPVLMPHVPEPGKGRGRPTGKRSNPAFEPTTVLLRKQTKRRASRLLEDIDSEHDLSELIEMLLIEWISRNS